MSRCSYCLALAVSAATTLGQAQLSPSTVGVPPAPSGVSSDWWSSVQQDISASEYRVTWQKTAPIAEVSSGWHAVNRAQNLRTYFTSTGFRAIPRATRNGETVAWQWGLSYIGYDGVLRATESVTPCVDANRVEYHHGNVIEWYVNDTRGLEQGFTVLNRQDVEVSKRPNGDTRNRPNAELRIELAVVGTVKAHVIDGGAAVDFLTPSGARPVRLAELHAFDAAGRALPAWFEGAGLLLTIAVKDYGAVYPITIDPLATSPGWITESNQASAELGVSVAGAGDVNGDGFGDVIVGAWAYDAGQTDEGRALVYYGSLAGPSGAPDWVFDGDQANAYLGRSVATAGDVNGDGYSDVIVGAESHTNGQTDEGRAYVFHGSAVGLAVIPAWIAESNQAGAFFGYSVSTAGDLNGDGYSDVIVGAYGFDNGQSNEGRAFAYHGSAIGLSATANWTAESNQASAVLGFSVSTAGDVNGDGYGDVIVGAYGFDNGQSDEGRAFVYHGSAIGLGPTANWTAEINSANSAFGRSVASAGDVNADGYSDVIIGANNYSNGESGEGCAFLYHGSPTGLSLAPNWTAEGNQISADFGRSVNTAGDVNGDSFGDVIIGSYHEDNGELDEGRVYVFHGSPMGLGVNPAWTVESNQVGASLGRSVATAGDVNGDGFSDVLVGADGFDNGETDEGRAFLYLGSASGLSATAGWTAEGDQASGSFGSSVASAGDVNGDGFADVIVGSEFYDNGSINEGRALVYHGSASGLSNTPAWSIESDISNARYGNAVSTAGDINGDGYSDVIVGASNLANGQSFEGRVYAYLGSATGLGVVHHWAAEGNQSAALFGKSVAAAGDVNGDGYGDIIIGASGVTNGETTEGRAYVYHGAASGLSPLPAWTAEGNRQGANFGYSVASAGDVNGDGFSDVIVGAYLDDNVETDEGRAFVFYGSITGLAAVPGWTAESNQASARFGESVASAGDVNGDGFSDVLVGADYYDNGDTDEGRAFLYMGSAAGLMPVPAWTFESNQAGANLGNAVAGAGDVNGDGFSDVVISAVLFDNLQVDEGRAWVFHGSAGGLDTSPNWTAESDQASAIFGYSAASTGDVNGDGFSDVVVAAVSYDNGQSNEGRIYLYYGNGGPAKTLTPQQRRPDNTAPIDHLGRSESSTAFRVSEFGRTPFGRGKVKLEYEVKPLGTPFDGTSLQQSAAYVDTGVGGAPLNELAGGLACGKPHHWRARTRYSPVTTPFQSAGLWVSPFGNGWQSVDVRTRYGTLGDMNCDCLLTVADLPAFVQALLAPADYAATYPLCGSGGGDINADGALNGADVHGFVDLLIP